MQVVMGLAMLDARQIGMCKEPCGPSSFTMQLQQLLRGIRMSGLGRPRWSLEGQGWFNVGVDARHMRRG
eukprot:scaffold327237_cov68-Tisochrysis_lutea.AAC.1